MARQAVIIGAGFAAEGHTIALRNAGVEVIALCGRTPEPARARAQKLGIEDLRFDWREAIEELQPDIVAITTPGKPHREMAEFAAQHRCHIACEKPLALGAPDAEAMLMEVKKAGVKHAYAATGCYSPQFAYVRQLLAQEIIGQVQEFEYVVRANFSPYQPYFWFFQLDQGGGCLYQIFTHMLSQMRRATGGDVRAVAGEARRLVQRAPVGPPLHDWRDFLSATVAPEQAEAGEWREVDADTGFTVLTRLEMPDGSNASGVFQMSWRSVSQLSNHLTFFGTAGTLQLTGTGWPEQIRHYNHERKSWQEMPVPEPLLGAAVQMEERDQVQWNQFYREFVADIRGEGSAGYPTFHDGWIANQIIDIVCSKRGWTSLLKDLALG